MSIEDSFRQIIREEITPVIKILQRHAPAEDRLMTAGEAAKLLQVSERWLYKHADRLPYAVRLSENVVRFSQQKIQEEIQRKLRLQAR